MHSYPREFSDQLLETLLRLRAARFAKLQGNAAELDVFKAHTERIEPIPCAIHLLEMIDAAFFSSLTQEEGDAVTFTVIYADPSVAIESEWPCIRLVAPLPLSTEHIRKLSPAAPPDSVDIAVFPFEGVLKIWGLLYVRRASPGQRSYPLGLTITSLQTGTLSAKFSDKELLSYSRGDAVFFDTDDSIMALQLRGVLAKAFARDGAFPENYKSAAALLSMCSVPLDLGSGATLLFLPHDHTVVGLDAPRFEADSVTCKRLAGALISQNEAYVTASVGRLLLIDGAVVFREGLGLLGAGAMIRTEDSGDFPIRIALPQYPKAKPIETSLLRFNGGARHRSALIFCYLNPGALAIVVSQDGVMSVMVRPLDDDGVFVLRPIRKGIHLS